MKILAIKFAILLIRLLSYLPFPILYALSKVIRLILSRVLLYRRTVIDLNLIHAFPDKTSRELWSIREKYYRHLSELIVESLKSTSISRSEFQRHIYPHHDSLQLFRKYEKTGKHIFVILGHYGNWEWSALLAGMESRLPFYALYQPGSNKTFDEFLVQTRSRFGCRLIGSNQVKSLYSSLQQGPSLVAFVADQTPVDTEKAYWTSFLNMRTPFYHGFAALAKKTDAIVLYTSVRKLETGYYELHLIPVTESAVLETEAGITEKFVRLLEKDIQDKPAYWLWSHRRWKRAGVSY